MPNVKWSITIQFVVVRLVLLAIHSNSVIHDVSFPPLDTQPKKSVWKDRINWNFIIFAFSAALEPPINVNPCIPSPCGPNSECHQIENRAVCSCAFAMLGTPPNCRPECVIHQECPLNRACISQQCQDPCIGACGFHARCTTQTHQPICSCMDGFDGDPYASCTPRQSEYSFLRFLILYPLYRQTSMKWSHKTTIAFYRNYHSMFSNISMNIWIGNLAKYSYSPFYIRCNIFLVDEKSYGIDCDIWFDLRFLVKSFNCCVKRVISQWELEWNQTDNQHHCCGHSLRTLFVCIIFSR